MKDGKVFGKINIIDLLVILIAIIIVVAVALKLTSPGSGEPGEKGTSIRYTVLVENVNAEFYETVSEYIKTAQDAGYPGDQLMASGELLDGYVVAVRSVPRPNEAYMSTSSGTFSVTAGSDDHVNLYFDVIANVTSNIKTNVGTQEVRTGKSHILKTTHFEFAYSVIQSCEWEGGTGAGY